MTSEQTDATGSTGIRTPIDRRQAMKAALGGTLAAAALAAPRIEGFSIVPDFAAASSQCPPGTAVNGAPNLSITSANCAATGAAKCWVAPTGTTTVNSASASYADPQLSATVTGQTSNGALALTLAGFQVNAPYSSCTVQVTGICGGGQAFTTNLASVPFTSNSTTNGYIRCTGGGNPSGAVVTIATSCICGPD